MFDFGCGVDYFEVLFVGACSLDAYWFDGRGLVLDLLVNGLVFAFSFDI